MLRTIGLVLIAALLLAVSTGCGGKPKLLTLKAYEAIPFNITYEETVKQIGYDGELLRNDVEDGATVKIYRFAAKGAAEPAYADLTYINDKLKTKVQLNMDPKLIRK